MEKTPRYASSQPLLNHTQTQSTNSFASWAFKGSQAAIGFIGVLFLANAANEDDFDLSTGGKITLSIALPVLAVISYVASCNISMPAQKQRDEEDSALSTPSGFGSTNRTTRSGDVSTYTAAVIRPGDKLTQLQMQLTLLLGKIEAVSRQIHTTIDTSDHAAKATILELCQSLDAKVSSAKVAATQDMGISEALAGEIETTFKAIISQIFTTSSSRAMGENDTGYAPVRLSAIDDAGTQKIQSQLGKVFDQLANANELFLQLVSASDENGETLVLSQCKTLRDKIIQAQANAKQESGIEESLANEIADTFDAIIAQIRESIEKSQPDLAEELERTSDDGDNLGDGQRTPAVDRSGIFPYASPAKSTRSHKSAASALSGSSSANNIFNGLSSGALLDLVGGFRKALDATKPNGQISYQATAKSVTITIGPRVEQGEIADLIAKLPSVVEEMRTCIANQSNLSAAIKQAGDE